MHRIRTFLPGIFEGGGCASDLRIQPVAYAFTVIDHDETNFVDAQAFDEVICTFEILCVFAVVLDEASNELHYFLVRIHGAQDIAFADTRSRGATDVYFPAAAIHRD